MLLWGTCQASKSTPTASRSEGTAVILLFHRPYPHLLLYSSGEVVPGEGLRTAPPCFIPLLHHMMMQVTQPALASGNSGSEASVATHCHRWHPPVLAFPW